MKIVKILNNNFAIVKEEDNVERIVTGKGICYGKKVGEKVERFEVDKFFYLQTETQLAKFEELITKLPNEQNGTSRKNYYRGKMPTW